MTCATVTAGAALTLAATATAGPGPVHRPPTTTAKTAPTPVHVVVQSAATLPGAHYAWGQPVFVRLPNGSFLVARPTA
ncbi:MAG: hypothetical protein ABUS54_07910 [Actinomycetota bacterium]